MQKYKITERSWVEIDLSALSHNLSYLKTFLRPEQHFMMIVKADAYGHGALEISRTAVAEGAVYLGVANPEEGRLLRLQGITEPILVLSPSLISETGTITANNLSVSISDLEFAKALNKEAIKANTIIRIHVKADTGMHRSGVNWQDFLTFWEAVAKLKNLEIEGIFSHFAASESDGEFSQIQEQRFTELLESLPHKPRFIHIANSNAVVRNLGQSGNLVRLGILAYGVDTENILNHREKLGKAEEEEEGTSFLPSSNSFLPSSTSFLTSSTSFLRKQESPSNNNEVPDQVRNEEPGNTSTPTLQHSNTLTLQHSSTPSPLTPVMTFKTILSQIKNIRQGESVGYNRSWIAEKDGLYGILPIGYADGYDFLLSNRGSVRLQNKLCKVIGRISMDMICIDLSEVESAQIGDVACLLGGSDPETRAENLVASYQGNPYELLCQVGRRAKRFYFRDGHLLHSVPLSRRDFVPDDFSDSKLNQVIEAALAQRLQSGEIGELIYREILRNFFYNKDKDIHYRHDFRHEIAFSDSLQAGYYKATTSLKYQKILTTDYFIVACADSAEVLERYFRRPDVEYRWLMDEAIELDDNSFSVSSVMVNRLVMKTEVSHKNGCLEIRCSHPELKKLIGKQVEFTINTHTLYPKNSHQFSVFISELTRGVDITFRYPKELNKVECITVFSGQDKYPTISQEEGSVQVSSREREWIFPISGVVFAY